MSKKKVLYLVVAVVGMSALGAAAWWFEMRPRMPGDPGEVKSADVRPAGEGQKGGADKGGADKGGAEKGKGGRGGGGPAAVEVVQVKVAAIQEDVAAVGSVRSNQSVMLRPEVAGRIAEINFSDGQPVRKGQVLVALDNSVNAAETAQARAELELAQNNLRRTQELAEKKFVSERARDEASSNVRVLEAKLRLSETRLARMTVIAPFDGIVGIRTVSVGDYVKDGADLVNLEDIRSVKIDFRLPERYAPLVRRGQAIEVTADALPNRKFRATIESINPLLDVTGRAVAIRAVANNNDTTLRPGMFARVRVILGERKGALLVPEEAIVPEGNDVYVFKVVDGKAQRTKVTLGLRRETEVEIVQGVSKDDVIVRTGQLRLGRDGTAVRVIEPGKGGGGRRGEGGPAPEGAKGGAPKGDASKGEAPKGDARKGAPA